MATVLVMRNDGDAGQPRGRRLPLNRPPRESRRRRWSLITGTSHFTPAQERYRSGRLLSPTLIEEGRLVSECVRLKNGADLVMGVCDLVRCGPITLVQSGCVWLGPQQVLHNINTLQYKKIQYGPDLVLGISNLVRFDPIW